MVRKIFIEVQCLEEEREKLNWFLIIQVNSETYSVFPVAGTAPSQMVKFHC